MDALEFHEPGEQHVTRSLSVDKIEGATSAPEAIPLVVIGRIPGLYYIQAISTSAQLRAFAISAKSFRKGREVYRVAFRDRFFTSL